MTEKKRIEVSAISPMAADSTMVSPVRTEVGQSVEGSSHAL